MPPTNADIMRELGGLTENVRNLNEKVIDADASRRVIHGKLDAQATIQNETIKTLSQVQFALQVTTDVAVQARDGLHKFEREFHENQLPKISAAASAAAAAEAWQTNAEPLLEQVRWVKRALITIAGLLTLGGVSVGAVAWNFNWIIKTAVRAWLELPLTLPVDITPILPL